MSAGTNRTRELITGGPVIILVEPQLGENIGMVARAMANFGLSELRLVNPRDGWPSEKARAVASKADHVIDGVKVFDTLEEAIADLNRLLATTARQRDMLKPVLAPDVAAQPDEIITFPVNPAFASLNIAQAVLLMSYEWMRTSVAEGETRFTAPDSIPASKESLVSLLSHLESALDEAKYFYPPEKREKMSLNLRNIFTHAGLQEQEVQSLHGVIAALERRWMRPRGAKPEPEDE